MRTIIDGIHFLYLRLYCILVSDKLLVLLSEEEINRREEVLDNHLKMKKHKEHVFITSYVYH